MKRKDIDTINLPGFEVSSGKLVISDPCYNLDTWCMGILENAKHGHWYSKVTKCNNNDGWGERCAELLVYHQEHRHAQPDTLCKFEVGVDSGQAGVFDYETFAKKELSAPYHMVGDMYYHKRMLQHHLVKEQEMYQNLKNARDKTLLELRERTKVSMDNLQEQIASMKAEVTDDWYRMCCDKTLGELGCGSIDGGVVSRSGYGDGGYEAFVATEGNEVVAVKVVFIPEYEDTEEEWDDEDF